MKRTRKVTPEGMQIKIMLLTTNMTARELAARIGKTDATICDVISGKNRCKVTLNRIMQTLREEESAAGTVENEIDMTDKGEERRKFSLESEDNGKE
ncbi:MAG: hypothetical protein LUE86_09905 [Clostridiales bacterium]|nr:hypothetical protein [Clostridiales bacterium]